MKKLLFAIIIVPFYCQAQIIATYAGNGVVGYSGDGGSATAAKFNTPDFVSMNDSGYLFVSDYANNVIRKISPSGIISTFAGNGTAGLSGDGAPASTAKLNHPAGVAFDHYGNVFIADWGNSRIRKVDAAGVITTIAGTTGGYSGDGGPATSAKLYLPLNLTFDTSGNLYIADHYNHVVRKINTSGIISTFAGNGTSGNIGDGGPATASELYFPFDVKFDAEGNLYVVDDQNMNIRKINTSGIISTFAGTGVPGYNGDSISATSAQLWAPTSLAIDNNNNIFVADGDNERVRMIDASGIIYTVAGRGVYGYSSDGGFADTTELSNPEGVALDACGNLYIAEESGQRVRKVTYLPNVTNVITVSADTICAAITVTYTTSATTSSGSVTYQWYVNGVPITGATNITYSYTPANADSIRCIATATNPCNSATTSSNTITMVVNPVITPTVTVTSFADTVCSGTSVTYTVTPGGGSTGLSYQWRVDGTPVTGATTTTYTYTPANGDSIRCIATSTAPCTISTTSSNTIIMVVNPVITPTITATSTADTVCAGTSVTFTSAATGGATGLTYQWRVNGSPVSGATVTTYTYTPANGDSIRCIATATAPCTTPTTSSNTIFMVVNPIITPTVTAISTADTVCTGTSVTFTSATSGATGLTYQWRVNGTPVTGATTASYTYIPTNGDSIRCVATSTAPYATPATSSNTIMMVVDPIITPTITVTAPAAAPVGSTVTVNATIAGAGSGYSINWYNNAVLFSTTSVPSTTYIKDTGTDHITATVVPGVGCYDSTTSAISTVTTSGLGNIPLSFGEGRGEVIYPNPVKNELHIGNINGHAEYKILSAVGDVLLQGVLEQGSNTINLKQLPDGVYTLEVTDNSGQRTVTKIIKQ